MCILLKWNSIWHENSMQLKQAQLDIDMLDVRKNQLEVRTSLFLLCPMFLASCESWINNVISIGHPFFWLLLGYILSLRNAVVLFGNLIFLITVKLFGNLIMVFIFYELTCSGLLSLNGTKHFLILDIIYFYLFIFSDLASPCLIAYWFRI